MVFCDKALGGCSLQQQTNNSYFRGPIHFCDDVDGSLEFNQQICSEIRAENLPHCACGLKGSTYQFDCATCWRCDILLSSVAEPQRRLAEQNSHLPTYLRNHIKRGFVGQILKGGVRNPQLPLSALHPHPLTREA